MSNRTFAICQSILAAIIGLAVAGLSPIEARTEAAPSAESRAISAAFPFEKHYVEILGSQMAYVDEGEGPVVLFLHGNPTSSYLWRNIIPYVSGTHRVIAVDLIGMGDSDQPDIDYRFGTHAAYLDTFIETLGLQDITLVVHDWGSGLGMRYARLNETNVRAIALMEALIPPALPAPSYEAINEPARTMFRNLRTPGTGEELVLDQNFFVESVLGQAGVVRQMTRQELNAYRGPFSTRQSRRPTLQWPREIPIGGTPADVTAEIQANGEWFYRTQLPKLLFFADPGALIPPQAAAYIAENAPNIEVVALGPATHFVQEDHPHAIGRALASWLAGLGQAESNGAID